MRLKEPYFDPTREKDCRATLLNGFKSNATNKLASCGMFCVCYDSGKRSCSHCVFTTGNSSLREKYVSGHKAPNVKKGRGWPT